MKTMIRIQSESKSDIELFFDLVEGVATKGSDTKPFEGGGVYTSVFEVDFKALHKNVTNKKKRKKKKVTKKNKVLKQDNKKNVKLSGIVGLYRSRGMSYQKIADKMNEEGYTNSRNLKIGKQQVFRLYEQYKQEEVKLLSKK